VATVPRSAAVVDVIGVGAGVVDRLGQQEQRVIAFNASARTEWTDSTGAWRFLNARSAAWWNLRERLDPSRGSTLMLPDDDDLIAELIAPRYIVRTGGVIYVEFKEEVSKRLGRSTDSGDSVIHAFWVSSLPRTAGPRRGRGLRVRGPRPRRIDRARLPRR
jgi:hypothetical protein